MMMTLLPTAVLYFLSKSDSLFACPTHSLTHSLTQSCFLEEKTLCPPTPPGLTPSPIFIFISSSHVDSAALLRLLPAAPPAPPAAGLLLAGE
jgi:hypothetical protein